MNPQDYDHPDLTAYALGELDPADAERVRKWLTQSPEAKAEFERVQQVLGFLQDAPTLPKRSLHPRQRDTVLAMGQIPAQGSASRPKNVVPFLAFRRPAGSGTQPSAVWQGVKYAAAACLMAGAFVLGQRTSNRVTPLLTSQDAPKVDVAPIGIKIVDPKASLPPPAPHIALTPAPAPKAADTVLPKVEAPVVSSPTVAATPTPTSTSTPTSTKAQAAPAPAPASENKTSPAVVAAAPSPAPVVVAAKPAAPGPVSVEGFYQPSKSPEAVLDLAPKAIRPLPVAHEFAGVMLASPLAPGVKPETQQKPKNQPGLEIHSWKAEIASCPWDSSRRLMRFVAQIPVAQAGIENFDQHYKLVAKFDPFHVQGYRLVTDKHMRPSGAGTLGTRFAWYEIIPTRNFNASAERPVTIGTISIEQPRGATRDPGPLPLVDKGTAWSDAREDFVFETAMTGWNMLLEGRENIGGLNSKLVLDLADKNRGEDAKGERAKFINAVRQAQRAVGM
jgi:hypothetical protein